MLGVLSFPSVLLHATTEQVSFHFSCSHPLALKNKNNTGTKLAGGQEKIWLNKPLFMTIYDFSLLPETEPSVPILSCTWRVT